MNKIVPILIGFIFLGLNANEAFSCQKCVNDIVQRLNIAMPKIKNIKKINFRKKIWSDALRTKKILMILQKRKPNSLDIQKAKKYLKFCDANEVCLSRNGASISCYTLQDKYLFEELEECVENFVGIIEYHVQ